MDVSNSYNRSLLKVYVVAYETSSKQNSLLDHALSMDNVCSRRLFSIPCKAFFKFWKVLSIMWIQQHLQMQ